MDSISKAMLTVTHFNTDFTKCLFYLSINVINKCIKSCITVTKILKYNLFCLLLATSEKPHEHSTYQDDKIVTSAFRRKVFLYVAKVSAAKDEIHQHKFTGNFDLSK